MLLDAHYEDGGTERYQVFVGWDLNVISELQAAALIGADGDRTGYDALYDEQSAQRLLGLIDTGATVDGIRFVPRAGRGAAGAGAGPGRRRRAEQHQRRRSTAPRSSRSSAG